MLNTYQNNCSNIRNRQDPLEWGKLKNILSIWKKVILIYFVFRDNEGHKTYKITFTSNTVFIVKEIAPVSLIFNTVQLIKIYEQ